MDRLPLVERSANHDKLARPSDHVFLYAEHRQRMSPRIKVSMFGEYNIRNLVDRNVCPFIGVGVANARVKGGEGEGETVKNVLRFFTNFAESTQDDDASHDMATFDWNFIPAAPRDEIFVENVRDSTHDIVWAMSPEIALLGEGIDVIPKL